MFNKNLLAIAAVCLLLCSSLPCCAEGDNASTPPHRASINLGAIESIEIPESWQLEKSDNPACRNFLKRRGCWWDCLIKLTIESPVKITPELAKSLQTTMLPEIMAKGQVDALKELPHFGTSSGAADSAEVIATAPLIDGRRMLIVERRGQFNGPCESIGAGRTRMPLLNYARGTAYMLTDSNSV